MSNISCSSVEKSEPDRGCIARLERWRFFFFALVFYILYSEFVLNTSIYPFFIAIWGLPLLVVLNLVGVGALSSLYRTKMSDPGFLNQDWDANISPDGMGDWDLCKACKLTLPARAFHCRQANRCVKRYDHYCPWADAPIGYFNYKFYFQLLCYGMVSTSVILLFCFHVMVAFHPFWETVPTSFYFLLLSTCLVLGGLTPLFAFHVVLLRLNITTKEWYVELRHQGKSEKGSLSMSKWDLGWRRNVEQLFGRPWWLWWSPFTAAPSGPGTSFPKNPDFKASAIGISSGR